MAFEKWEQAKYRSADADALEKRKAEIADELENEKSDVATDDLIEERDMCLDAIRRRSAATEVRSAKVVEGFEPHTGAQAAKTWDNAKHRSGEVRMVREEDPYDTEAYHRAFAEYVTRGKAIEGIETRANAFTTVASDAGNVVPTQLMNTIVEKQTAYGDLFAGVTKTSYPGGVQIPTADIAPTASWITEKATSSDQKLAAGANITFSYYGLEVKLAQSVLASAITLSSFEAKFAEAAARAMVQAKETGIISGTGSGQMLGVTVDSRVPAANKISMADADLGKWDAWHKFVKAKMKKAYRDGEFIMNQATFDAYIDGMVDSNGQPVGRTNYGINGEEQYRFMGKTVHVVDDDILPDFDSAAAGGAFCIFMRLSDYAINSALPMRTNRWSDHDNNLEKLQMLEFLDGKLVDPYGVLVISKPSA